MGSYHIISLILSGVIQNFFLDLHFCNVNAVIFGMTVSIALHASMSIKVYHSGQLKSHLAVEIYLGCVISDRVDNLIIDWG